MKWSIYDTVLSGWWCATPCQFNIRHKKQCSFHGCGTMGDASNDLTWSSPPLKAAPLIHDNIPLFLPPFLVRVTRLGDEETV